VKFKAFLIHLPAFFVTSRALPFDYYNDEVTGNAINGKDNANYQASGDDYYHDSGSSIDANKRDPEVFVGGQKRNIISALRMAKIRRSKPIEEIEDKLRFSPVLSVGELMFRDGEAFAFFVNSTFNQILQFEAFDSKVSIA
jgi:hypothetical protein